MARLPDIIHYKFYGPGIPKSRAIKWMTVHNIKTQASHIDRKKHVLVMNFTMRKQRHAGILLLKLALWLHRFASAKEPWFKTLETTEWL